MALYLSRVLCAFIALITLVARARASHDAAVAAALRLRPSAQLYYWNSVLPDTPMPKALSQLVQPAQGLVRPDQDEAHYTANDNNPTRTYGKGNNEDTPAGNVTWRYGKGGENEDAPGGNLTWRYGKGGENEDVPGGNLTWRYKGIENEDTPGGNITWRYGKGIENEDAPASNISWRYGKGGENEDAPASNISWRYGKGDNKDDATSDNQHYEEEPTRSVIAFLEKDVHPGKTMKCSLARDSSSTFLSRNIADSIPFSSGKLPEILKRLSVKPGSPEASKIMETLQDCEGPAVKGEDKYCATSLESMIDYAISKLGRNVQVVSSEVERGATHLQDYTIALGVKKLAKDTVIVCHKLQYAYAVFYCHQVGNTKAYMVPLVGPRGTHAKGVAICHLDTSAWNPNHIFLQALKVKPGTVPVCHFLPEGTIAWVRKQQKHALRSAA